MRAGISILLSEYHESETHNLFFLTSHGNVLASMEQQFERKWGDKEWVRLIVESAIKYDPLVEHDLFGWLAQYGYSFAANDESNRGSKLTKIMGWLLRGENIILDVKQHIDNVCQDDVMEQSEGEESEDVDLALLDEDEMKNILNIEDMSTYPPMTLSQIQDKDKFLQS